MLLIPTASKIQFLRQAVFVDNRNALFDVSMVLLHYTPITFIDYLNFFPLL
jgi:hypothetical protein